MPTPSEASLSVWRGFLLSKASGGRVVLLAMKFVYHMAPADFRGTTLYPLNQLRSIHPDLYEAGRQRYVGRERIMQAVIPSLGVLWNDVVHCAPIHPARVRAALAETGNRTRDRRWFKIPGDRLEGLPVVWYSYKSVPDRLDSDFESFDPARYQELHELPPETQAYYAECSRAGRPPLLFHLVPHVLVAGPIDVDGVELVDWSVPVEPVSAA